MNNIATYFGLNYKTDMRCVYTYIITHTHKYTYIDRETDRGRERGNSHTSVPYEKKIVRSPILYITRVLI